MDGAAAIASDAVELFSQADIVLLLSTVGLNSHFVTGHLPVTSS